MCPPGFPSSCPLPSSPTSAAPPHQVKAPGCSRPRTPRSRQQPSNYPPAIPVRLLCTVGTPSATELDTLARLADSGWNIAVRAAFDASGIQHMRTALSAVPRARPWRMNANDYVRSLHPTRPSTPWTPNTSRRRDGIPLPTQPCAHRAAPPTRKPFSTTSSMTSAATPPHPDPWTPPARAPFSRGGSPRMLSDH
ncbi:DUF2399 domain-containing protein [Streptomyces sp. NPDC048560]|uniref:DUF2399 domain-containing protein n=1 Tax=Streptomyces sp. NPDC048560 TaxID=3155488 RepID=UPI00341AEA8B